MKTVLTALLFISSLGYSQDTCLEYTETNGLVIMEAEHTSSILGAWFLKLDVANYKGSGHLEFGGNSITNGPPSSPLHYTFQINQTAEYRVLLRARKRLTPGQGFDKSNDCYIRVSGDFEASDRVEERNYGDASLEILKKNTKIFGGNPDDWGKAFTLDLGGHDNKRVPVYKFKAGETYTVTISGRSKQFNLDRIIFYKNGPYNLNDDKIAIMDATSETRCDYTLSQTPLNHIEKNFTISPNPIVDKQLHINHKKPQHFKLYTVQGKLVQTFFSKDTKAIIDLHHLPSGMYLLQAATAEIEKIVLN